MALRRPLILVVAIAALGLATADLHATPASDASNFIGGLVHKALTALNDKNMTDAERARHFRQVLDNDFDFPRIARFVLGHYWNEASEQDRQRFQQLFEDYVVRSYAARFSEYHGELVKITGARPESETSSIVMSEIVRPNGAPPVRIDWRVRTDANGLRIVDIDVEGVSMVLTQREEFTSVIRRNGGTVAGLNRELEQKLANGDTSLAPSKNP